jgi:hypothetical protein
MHGGPVEGPLPRERLPCRAGGRGPKIVSVLGSNSFTAARSRSSPRRPRGLISEPALGASSVTVCSTTNGSSTPTYAAFTTRVAAIMLAMNAVSSAGGKVAATILQAGVG